MKKTMFFLCLALMAMACTKTETRARSPAFSKTAAAAVPVRPKVYFTLLLNLNGGLSNQADAVMTIYDPAFKIAVDGWDSYKGPFANPDENLAINERGTLLGMDAKPLVSRDSTFLQMWQFRQSEYYLRIEPRDWPAGYSGRIYDRYLKTSRTVTMYGVTNLKFTAIESPAVLIRYKFYITKN